MLESTSQAKEDLEKAAEGEGETSKDAADMQQGDIVSVSCHYSTSQHRCKKWTSCVVCRCRYLWCMWFAFPPTKKWRKRC